MHTRMMMLKTTLIALGLITHTGRELSSMQLLMFLQTLLIIECLITHIT